MSLEDPFFVVKDEVLKALSKTRELFDRWKSADEGREVRSVEEQEWAATELRNSLRSIEWDLEDLDDTVQIVEKNPAKFRIDTSELAVRKNFIVQTREEVRQMKDRTTQSCKGDEIPMDTVNLGSPEKSALLPSGVSEAQPSSSSSNKYSRLPNDDAESPSRSSRGMEGLLRQQQQLVRDQDDQLTAMSDSVGNLRDVSHAIGSELDEQAVMLDEFGTEIENAETKLDATMRKMANVLHMSNDRRQWMAIGVLSSAVLVVLMLIFAL